MLIYTVVMYRCVRYIRQDVTVFVTVVSHKRSLITAIEVVEFSENSMYVTEFPL